MILASGGLKAFNRFDAPVSCLTHLHDLVAEMTSVGKNYGINDNMSLIAVLIVVPLLAFLGFKLFSLLKEDSDKDAAKQAKRDAKKTRTGSKKE